MKIQKLKIKMSRVTFSIATATAFGFAFQGCKTNGSADADDDMIKHLAKHNIGKDHPQYQEFEQNYTSCAVSPVYTNGRLLSICFMTKLFDFRSFLNFKYVNDIFCTVLSGL